MMRPGYYLTLGETVLHSPDGPYKVRIHREEWLVTNGSIVGRFDQDVTWEWHPLEWTHGHMLVLTPELARQLDDVSIVTTFPSLEGLFRGLTRVDEDEPEAPELELPRPPLRDGLGTYLRVRRSLI